MTNRVIFASLTRPIQAQLGTPEPRRRQIIKAVPPCVASKRLCPARGKECCSTTASMYEAALELAREERYDAARTAFEELCVETCPSWVKPWISWAQMEKRAARQKDLAMALADEHWHRCRIVLQRALEQNRSAAQIIQAWGLMELQRGNLLPAVRLLERCAVIDSGRCAPVLRWKPVAEARKTVGSRKQRSTASSSTATNAAKN